MGEQHIPLGMIMALNILPSKQKPIPADVPTEGPCPVWSSTAGKAVAGDGKAMEQMHADNVRLEQQVKDLEAKLERQQSQCNLQNSATARHMFEGKEML